MRSIKVLAALTMAVASLGGVARAAAPALFEVGFGVRTINPVKPQALGGFGYDGDSPTNVVHDPLQVRAIAIKHGANMVLMAIVDTQGYFSGNQEGPWGSFDARTTVANTLAARKLNVTTANIIVSSTHSHAAPTIMGIWGIVDPEYLKSVYEGTVGALLDAADAVQPANLYAGEGNIDTVNVWGVSQTDGYQGWTPDGKLPVLWARDPSTGRTLGLYANVPTHADIVEGSALNEISADHIGVERARLDDILGGTSVIAMGTLGRQESIVQVRGYAHADAVGQLVTNEILRAMGDARPIVDDTVAGAEQYMLLPATNPALAALNLANAAQPTCLPGADVCTIDRAFLPPFAAGASFGTWFTALRIGDVVYASEPGEAFPEVSTGIRAAMGAPDVRIIGMAQDQLGYYYPVEATPIAAAGNIEDLTDVPLPNGNDHFIYNSSALLGEFNVQAQALNAVTLGFTPQPAHQTMQWDDMNASQNAGVQFFPLATESASATRTFDARWSGAAIGGAGTGGPITWDFGDGTTATSGQLFTTHAFPGSGTYKVRASIPEGASWTRSIIVDPPLFVHAEASGDDMFFDAHGGSKKIVRALWSFDDGTTAEGSLAPVHGHGSLTVTDSAGNTATGSF